MAAGLALARAKVTTADGTVRYANTQISVRRGVMRTAVAGVRSSEPGVTDVEQVSPSVWVVSFEGGEALTVERIARKCGTCAGKR